MQPAKNYGWSKGKKLRLEEGKLSVGMQPEITPLRLVESPGGGATARGLDPWDQHTCLTGVSPRK